jgi:GTPase SAR1 family protein
MSSTTKAEASAAIALSLVSHTNVGKTTLARTLLGRDVGEVRDAPHVTEFADAFTLIETEQGEALRLWDTPGFGDSVRLARRMRQSGNPLGWFLSEVWDRWRDRPFWSSQEALRNVRDQADVVLYLVNASEEPAAAGYVAPEMELLAWTNKPVIVLLNQLGEPRAAALEEADVQRWHDHLARRAKVLAVLPLDAFARCWVQELTLLQAIAEALVGDRRALMLRLTAAWLAQRRRTFDAAMQSMARGLAGMATDRQRVDESTGLGGRLRRIGAALGLGNAAEGPIAEAQAALAGLLAGRVREGTAELIALHGLDGQAEGEILHRVATHYELRLKVDEGNAAVLGGMLTGALAGLKADIATGGLTLGGGMLTGGALGALGAAGLARGYNLIRGLGHSSLSWKPEALDAMLEAALLRYLAVAHFGRGRGNWAQGESPPHWIEVVAAALAPQREALNALWGGRSGREPEAGEQERLVAALKPIFTAAATDALRRLYPAATAQAMADAPAITSAAHRDNRGT